jgi:hypothetical protein
MRQCKGPATVGQLRDVARNSALLQDIGENCWGFMKNIRGTAAYWQSARRDLFSMIGTCGPPTWFTTFSANDFGWNDLALVLAPEPVPLEAQEQFLADLTPEARREMFLNDQVAAIVTYIRWSFICLPFNHLSPSSSLTLTMCCMISMCLIR